MIFNQIPG